jgi:hypothetical protein
MIELPKIDQWFQAGLTMEAVNMVIGYDSDKGDDTCYPIYINEEQDIPTLRTVYTREALYEIVQIFDMTGDLDTQLTTEGVISR